MVQREVQFKMASSMQSLSPKQENHLYAFDLHTISGAATMEESYTHICGHRHVAMFYYPSRSQNVTPNDQEAARISLDRAVCDSVKYFSPRCDLVPTLQRHVAPQAIYFSQLEECRNIFDEYVVFCKYTHRSLIAKSLSSRSIG